MAIFSLPLVNFIILKFYSLLSTLIKIGYYDLNTPITVYESTSIIVSIIGIVVTAILTFLIYRVNKIQLEIIEKINNSKPEIKMFPSKIAFNSKYENHNLIRRDLLCKDEVLFKKTIIKGNVKDLIRTDLNYSTSIMIELIIYNAVNNGLAIIVMDIAIEIYNGDEIVVNKKHAEKFIIKDLREGGKNFSPDKEFEPLYIEAQGVFQGIIEFKELEEILKENTEYTIRIYVYSPDKEFRFNCKFKYAGLLSKINEESYKIEKAIRLATYSNLTFDGKNILNYGERVDLLLRGKGSIGLNPSTISNTNICVLELIE